MKKVLFLFSFLFLIISCEKDIDSIEEESFDPDLVCEGCDIKDTLLHFVNIQGCF